MLFLDALASSISATKSSSCLLRLTRCRSSRSHCFRHRSFSSSRSLASSAQYWARRVSSHCKICWGTIKPSLDSYASSKAALAACLMRSTVGRNKSIGHCRIDGWDPYALVGFSAICLSWCISQLPRRRLEVHEAPWDHIVCILDDDLECGSHCVDHRRNLAEIPEAWLQTPS